MRKPRPTRAVEPWKKCSYSRDINTIYYYFLWVSAKFVEAFLEKAMYSRPRLLCRRWHPRKMRLEALQNSPTKPGGSVLHACLSGKSQVKWTGVTLLHVVEPFLII